MGRWKSFNPLRGLLVGLLCFALLGCGLVNPQPPRSVVVAAISTKLSQTQSLLSRQLDLSDRPQVAETVRQVRITERHWTILDQRPLMQVRGTYRLSGTGWSRSQQPQAFEIYLQRGENREQWLLVDSSAQGFPPVDIWSSHS